MAFGIFGRGEELPQFLMDVYCRVYESSGRAGLKRARFGIQEVAKVIYGDALEDLEAFVCFDKSFNIVGGNGSLDSTTLIRISEEYRDRMGSRG